MARCARRYLLSARAGSNPPRGPARDRVLPDGKPPAFEYIAGSAARLLDYRLLIDRIVQPAPQCAPGFCVQLAQQAAAPRVPQRRIRAVDICDRQREQVVQMLFIAHMQGKLLDNLPGLKYPCVGTADISR